MSRENILSGPPRQSWKEPENKDEQGPHGGKTKKGSRPSSQNPRWVWTQVEKHKAERDHQGHLPFLGHALLPIPRVPACGSKFIAPLSQSKPSACSLGNHGGGGVPGLRQPHPYSCLRLLPGCAPSFHELHTGKLSSVLTQTPRLAPSLHPCPYDPSPTILPQLLPKAHHRGLPAILRLSCLRGGDGKGAYTGTAAELAGGKRQKRG